MTLPSHVLPTGPSCGRDDPAFALRAGRMRLAALVLLLLAFEPRPSIANVAPDHSAAHEVTEYSVKAAAIVHFVTQYVKWPPTAHKDRSSPYVVGVLGKDPFGRSLVDAFKGRQVGERSIKVVNFASVDDLEDCHLLFVSTGSEKQMPKVRQFCELKPILIVAESVAAVKAGAHIAITIEKSKPKLSIHPASAKRAKLELSSELLKLAEIIEDKEKKP